jgi:protein O-mannosyl-transferase
VLKHPTLGLVLILAATCIVYSPALTGGFVWDDEMYVTKPALQSTDGLWRIWFEPRATPQYYPLLYSAFWLQHRLWGEATAGYHATNLALHLIAVGLVYVLLKKLESPGALLAAGIFAMHPVHVETVAWISEQKNTLSAVFYLFSLLVYLRFDAERLAGRTRWLPYFGALVLFICSVLSKSVTVTLPAAILVILWWRRGKLAWRDVLPLAPFFVIGLGYGLLTAYLESAWVGASGAAYEMSPAQRGLVAGRVIWFYLGKLFFPAGLAFSYPKWNIDPSEWSQWLYPCGVLALTAVLWRLSRQSRAPLAGFLFFAGTLFPALGFVNVYPFRYSFVADHFQYLASLGVIALAASGISVAFDRVVYRNGRPAR